VHDGAFLMSRVDPRISLKKIEQRRPERVR
jgi:hypothetical protein